MIYKSYDVIVIGAGHAGLEAVFICEKLNLKVCLLTINKNSVGLMPCNPSIGGPAKGIVTREIDALGGIQAIATDETSIQTKMLNISKGAGVRALRAQVDKILYHQWFINQIKTKKNIDLIENEVVGIINKKNQAIGVNLINGNVIKAKTVIITTGTYLHSLVHVGGSCIKSGPKNFKNSEQLSKNLKQLGFELLRLKTGTPPRVHKDSIDYDQTQIENGSKQKLLFSHFVKNLKPLKQNVPCYLTYTNLKTHKLIQNNINLSATYSGQISGIGPLYCPSIEDKVIRFKDHDRHQIFIEPESLSLDTMYIQGLSNAFPKDIQEKIVHSIDGLHQAKILEYAYAIEYDAINPNQLKPSLESKKIKNLFFAGQINGTSGYEEAACQGLMAGINAYLKIKNKEPFILKRHEAYIGVLIDDLVTKGITDPYRLLTSRAEYRLNLRNDNADERLIKYGFQLKTIDNNRYKLFLKQQKTIESVIKYLKTHFNKSNSLFHLLKRADTKLIDLLPLNIIKKLNNESINKIEILVKFEGYIKNQQLQINRFNKYEDVSLSKIKDYKKLQNLSLEAINKLNKIKPLNLGQAKRISGINLTDLFIIKNYLDKIK